MSAFDKVFATVMLLLAGSLFLCSLGIVIVALRGAA